jgi:hypothetical protein
LNIRHETAESHASNSGRIAGHNEGDIRVWNGFSSKLGWNDFATQTLERLKQKYGIADRADIVTIPDLIDFDEGRKS